VSQPAQGVGVRGWGYAQRRHVLTRARRLCLQASTAVELASNGLSVIPAEPPVPARDLDGHASLSRKIRYSQMLTGGLTLDIPFTIDEEPCLSDSNQHTACSIASDAGASPMAQPYRRPPSSHNWEQPFSDFTPASIGDCASAGQSTPLTSHGSVQTGPPKSGQSTPPATQGSLSGDLTGAAFSATCVSDYSEGNSPESLPSALSGPPSGRAYISDAAAATAAASWQSAVQPLAPPSSLLLPTGRRSRRDCVSSIPPRRKAFGATCTSSNGSATSNSSPYKPLSSVGSSLSSASSLMVTGADERLLSEVELGVINNMAFIPEQSPIVQTGHWPAGGSTHMTSTSLQRLLPTSVRCCLATWALRFLVYAGQGIPFAARILTHHCILSCLASCPMAQPLISCAAALLASRHVVCESVRGTGHVQRRVCQRP
jgi:hypothetical protein